MSRIGSARIGVERNGSGRILATRSRSNCRRGRRPSERGELLTWGIRFRHTFGALGAAQLRRIVPIRIFGKKFSSFVRQHTLDPVVREQYFVADDRLRTE